MELSVVAAKKQSGKRVFFYPVFTSRDDDGNGRGTLPCFRAPDRAEFGHRYARFGGRKPGPKCGSGDEPEPRCNFPDRVIPGKLRCTAQNGRLEGFFRPTL